jgi:hypothetical protein
MVVSGLDGACLSAEQPGFGNLVVYEELMALGAYALRWLQDAAPSHHRPLSLRMVQ